VIDDCLKLTSYFGERTRVEGRFFSEALLDTFEEYDISSSILLRATGGFGLRHHVHSDQTLTMSEDPSVMAIATDSRSRIESVLPRVESLQPRGMLTVERTRLVRGDVAAGSMPEQLHEATKLSIYVGRHEQVYRMPAYLAVCELLHRRGIAGASVLVGVDGSTHGARERARFWDRNREVPTMILAIGEGARIQRILPELGGLLSRPMVTVERVRVCKRDGELLARPHELPSHDRSGLALRQKLMIYTSESHLHDGQPVHRSIIARLRATSARGATSLRGVWGFHGDHQPHGDRLLQVGRRVPVVTVVVDTPENIAASFDVIDELTAEHGLVTSEMVPAMRYFGAAEHGSLQLADHDF
jgi:PII-like signaling protein